MKPALFYRIASVLLALLAVGHLLGFTQTDPGWGIDSLLASMHTIHFNVQGFHRSYWDFFLGGGYTVGILYVFATLLSWQLGNLPAETLLRLRVVTWAFALSFVAITMVAVLHLFVLPIVQCGLIAASLLTAAALSSRQTSAGPLHAPDL